MKAIIFGKIYLIGALFLIYAILINVISAKIGLLGWYDFLFKKNLKINIFNYIYLFIIYPILLGTGVYFFNKFFFNY